MKRISARADGRCDSVIGRFRLTPVTGYLVGGEHRTGSDDYLMLHIFSFIYQNKGPWVTLAKGQKRKLTTSAATLRQTFSTSDFDEYKNLFYPLERPLIESFVRAAVGDEKIIYVSSWGELLRSWISTTIGYLNVDNDLLDMCEDERAAEWFSAKFGRKYGACVWATWPTHHETPWFRKRNAG
jgi:hypothetical protein